MTYLSRSDHNTASPDVQCRRLRHHKGSIYCVAWNSTGDIVATGSNDKSIKMMRYNCDDHSTGKKICTNIYLYNLCEPFQKYIIIHVIPQKHFDK